MRDRFARFAGTSAQVLGSAWAFTLYLALITVWLVTGPLTHWSDTWQLVANTATSLGTTAICLLIQNTVNRDTRALQLKLDELLRAHSGARTGLVDLESLPQEQQERLAAQFRSLREREEQGDGDGDGKGATRSPPPGQGEDEAGR